MLLQGFISWSIICTSRTRINTALKQEQMTSQVFTPEALILKVSTRVCCHTSHHLTLWTVTKASLFPPSWYLHLSARNHKYNHFPNVGSLFCQLFQSVTVPLHFPCMNKWKAINMSLSLNSGSLHHAAMLRTACLPGSGGSDVRFVRWRKSVTVQKLFTFCWQAVLNQDDWCSVFTFLVLGNTFSPSLKNPALLQWEKKKDSK